MLSLSQATIKFNQKKTFIETYSATINLLLVNKGKKVSFSYQRTSQKHTRIYINFNFFIMMRIE
jgi:hypothetical protein